MTPTTLTLPPAPERVTVTVNGVEMQLPKGKNLLQALLDVGHAVPHYCYQPALSVDGNCRLCLVEIEGRPKPEISCNMTVVDGLKIKTEGQLVEDCRNGMMEFLLANHPLDCPICDRGGECMLQRYSMEYGQGSARTSDVRRRFHKPQFDKLIDIERNRCIMCTRCVRFMDEIGEDHVLGVFGHGSRNYIGTYGDGPVSNIFSGNIIDLCPVGCLTSKPFRFKARVWELRQTPTATRSTNGAVTAWTRGGTLHRVTPPAKLRKGYYTIDEDTTKFISNEARFGSYYANSDDRLLFPTVRDASGSQVRVKWSQALDTVAEALGAAMNGKTAILAGERSTNEEFFLLSKLARTHLKTPHIDWRSRFTSDAAAIAAGDALLAGNGDLDLLEQKAYGATLMINGCELYQSAPDIALRLKEASRRGQTALGVVDSRVDKWMARHAKSVFLESPEKTAALIDSLADGIAGGKAPKGAESLFALLKDNAQGLLVLGLDAAGGELNPELVKATLKLKAQLGDAWHFLPVTGARNAKGAVGCGGQSDRLPSSNAPETIGDSAPAILRRAAAGEFKALLLHRADELVVHTQRELIEQAIDNTPFVAVVDVFPSWITAKANVVLPGSMFFENNGSVADIDGTLQRMSQGGRPRGEGQEEWRIIDSLIQQFDSSARFRKADDIFAELAKAWGREIKLTDLTLGSAGAETPQRHHRYTTQRTRPGWKLNLCVTPPTRILEPAEPASASGPRLLWIRHSQGEDHLGSRSTEFDAVRPRPRVELNPADAKAAGLAEGDWVLLQDGSARPSQVRLNDLIAPGVIFGAFNVLGLRLDAEAPGLPIVKLTKTEAPAVEEPVAEHSETEEVPVA